MTRQAIVTRELGPTTHRSMRIKATCQGGSVTVPWNHDRGTEGNHAIAARALAEKMGWRGVYVPGGLPSGDIAWVDASRPFIDGERVGPIPPRREPSSSETDG